MTPTDTELTDEELAHLDVCWCPGCGTTGAWRARSRRIKGGHVFGLSCNACDWMTSYDQLTRWVRRDAF